ncbi:MAG: AmmeMemoRadiSam system protein B [Candidatus Acidiferrales bacterium]
MIRQPAVAGRFYPADARELEISIRQFLSAANAGAKAESGAETSPQAGAKARADNARAETTRAVACLVPHAGYMYSGGVAAAVFARLANPMHANAPRGIPRRAIILGPRHRPPGAELAIQSDGAWRTPLGLAPIDSALARALMAACPSLQENDVAHRREHSIEVEVPFLQVLAGKFSFVPIAIGTVNFDKLAALGDALAKVITASATDGEPILMIASSDLNHHEPDDVTRAKDRFAIDQMLALDPRGLYDAVRREGITMCGVGPAVAALTAARKLGATRGELVCYATSADTSAERDSVVGYAGMIFH